MQTQPDRRSLWLAALMFLSLPIPHLASATIVEIQTVLGDFEVNLYDNDAPATVANFLGYVNNGSYTNTLFHRSSSNFVIQAGGFTFDTALPLIDIPENTAVVNEPEFANVRGTIAMAKLGGDPNSATSQWFFNLADNTANLDIQNGGFTVFGEVVGNGMDVVDAIAALQTFDFGSPFDNLPLQNYTTTDFNNNVSVDGTHLIIISAVVVTDSTVDSAAGLNPPATTATSGEVNPSLGGDSGGGSTDVGFAMLFLALCLWILLRSRRIGHQPI